MEDVIDLKIGENMEQKEAIDSKVSKVEKNMEKVDEKVKTLTKQNSVFLNEATLTWRKTVSIK